MIKNFLLFLIGLFFLSAYSYGQMTEDEMYEAMEKKYRGHMRIYPDTALYQGFIVKVDIGNTLISILTSHARIRSYEGGLSIRLKRRFYPTVEFGYARALTGASGGESMTKGFFLKPGLDINGLRKHPESLNALLVGIRIGYAYQRYDAFNVFFNDTYWQRINTIDYPKQSNNDVWGEIVAGCNVHIYSGLMMGWFARLKILFTRSAHGKPVQPYYIPGYGYRDNTTWGFNYYIAFKF